jgi:hypothetical protein
MIHTPHQFGPAPWRCPMFYPPGGLFTEYRALLSTRDGRLIGEPQQRGPIMREHKAGFDRCVGIALVALEVDRARGIELGESRRGEWFG